MLWFTRSWGKFLNLRAACTSGRQSKNLTILRCSSESSRPFNSPKDYFIPPAYRKHKPGQFISNRATGINKRRPSPQHSRRLSPHVKGRSINLKFRPHRSRKKLLGQRGSSIQRRSQLCINDLRQVENMLIAKLSQCSRQAEGFSSLGFHGSPESLRGDDNELYKSIVSDFKTLIIGWSEFAESICAAKRTEKSLQPGRNVGLDKLLATTAILASDYEDAVLRAERHLESFETFSRNHGNRIATLGDIKEEKDETRQANNNVLKKISAYLASYFSDINPTKEKEEEGSVGARAQQITPSQDLHLNPFLYKYVLSANQKSNCFDWHVKERSTKRSHRLLNRWISSHSVTNNDSFYGAKPQRKLFHSVIRQYVDDSMHKDVTMSSGTPKMKQLQYALEGVERAEEWLVRMRYLEKSGWVDCGPDVDTYNLVLLGFCNLCKLFLHNRANTAYNTTKDSKDDTVIRQFVIEGVQRMMSELTGIEDGSLSSNILSLNLALAAIAKVSDDTTANKMIFNTIGEKAFLYFLGTGNKKHNTTGDSEHLAQSEKETQNAIHPNLDTYHWVVHLYSASGNPLRVEQGMALLRRMIEIRTNEDPGFSIHGNGPKNAVASFSPSIGTHNNVLRALVKLSEMAHGIDACTTASAKEATGLLNTMPQYVSSFPNPITFLFMMQMWQKSRSPDAGDYAEKILSRMEIAGAYQNESNPPHSNAYVLALQCWLTAARAGRSGAAECAFRLFKISEAQSEPTFSGPQNDHVEIKASDPWDRPNLTRVQMYSSMMNICAATYVKQDVSRAMTIGFKIFDKLKHDRIKPSLQRFEDLYRCVRNFLDHHPDEEKKRLLKKVFDPASSHGITRGELIGRHKQSLRKASNKSYATRKWGSS